jgi:hypothetical protein
MTKDNRPRRHSPRVKYAIDRDGDLFIVECPVCHYENGLYWNSEEKFFECERGVHCQAKFKVYTEDGIIKFLDHKEGDIPYKNYTIFKIDSEWHAGINEEVFWFFPKRVLYRRDLVLNNGKDSHGHDYYLILPTLPNQPYSENCNSC